VLIPLFERLILRDLIRRSEREGRKVEAVREAGEEEPRPVSSSD
jgi:hypothetical protein